LELCVLMEEQFILKITWLAEGNNKTTEMGGTMKRCQYFGPFGKEALDEKLTFYQHKARYGARVKRFEIFSGFGTRAIHVGSDGVMEDV